MRRLNAFEDRRVRLDERYEVGADGVVYSEGLPLKALGGVSVKLHGELRTVAYLVARAFVPNPEGRPWVRHLNGDVKDNRAENLEWSEVKEAGRRRGPKPGVMWCSAWTRNGERVGEWSSPSEAARETGVNVRWIRNALGGKQKTAGGLFWSLGKK